MLAGRAFGEWLRLGVRIDAQDVAVGVAKPGLAEVPGRRDAVLGFDVREVVLFEVHATVAQLVDGGFQVAYLPRRECVLSVTRGRPFVDFEQRAATAPVEHLRAGRGYAGLDEPEFLAVEGPARSRSVVGTMAITWAPVNMVSASITFIERFASNLLCCSFRGAVAGVPA